MGEIYFTKQIIIHEISLFISVPSWYSEIVDYSNRKEENFYRVANA